ncbi:phosphatidylinositol N-acetylglucosaminyltransferase subunit C [Catenaria anguillulae PL171]|uniref:Phosphatidylinositol N-acetylglucosaminyltransferase subunit C n=1 Tax=Catenaria anguillulae PL171 TaxID=765915 RepID=A0A1Y2HHV9_9FUNG|nr:phosphatidylinositol N-acetylglucosaminyltransferase subunit C [Catenaria anguillulae PL171]
MMSRGQQPPWRKVLFLRQPYPDNYVPPSFLHLLRTNVGVHVPPFTSLVLLSLRVTLQFAIITCFTGVFSALFTGLVAQHHVLAICLILALLMLPPFVSLNFAEGPAQIRAAAKSFVLFVTTLLALSPILSTLTIDVSSDSIWSLSAVCLACNLLLNDYRVYRSVSLKFPASIATNMAVFASVLLASRLKTTESVFSLMTLSAEMFVLLPLLHRNYGTSPIVTIMFALSLLIASVVLWWFVSSSMVTGIVCVSASVTFLCPLWLQRLYRLKNTVHGPWDQAVIMKTEISRFR